MPVNYNFGLSLANFPIHQNETFISTAHLIKPSKKQHFDEFIKDLIWNKYSIFVHKVTKYAFRTKHTTSGNGGSICEMSRSKIQKQVIAILDQDFTACTA